MRILSVCLAAIHVRTAWRSSAFGGFADAFHSVVFGEDFDATDAAAGDVPRHRPLPFRLAAAVPKGKRRRWASAARPAAQGNAERKAHARQAHSIWEGWKVVETCKAPCAVPELDDARANLPIQPCELLGRLVRHERSALDEARS